MREKYECRTHALFALYIRCSYNIILCYNSIISEAVFRHNFIFFNSMVLFRDEYFEWYREENREKLRKYNREWMRRWREKKKKAKEAWQKTHKTEQFEPPRRKKKIIHWTSYVFCWCGRQWGIHKKCSKCQILLHENPRECHCGKFHNKPSANNPNVCKECQG